MKHPDWVKVFLLCEKEMSMSIGVSEASDGVTRGESQGLCLNKEEMMILEDPIIPFYLMFATKQWSREESMSMPVTIAEAAGEGVKKNKNCSHLPLWFVLSM